MDDAATAARRREITAKVAELRLQQNQAEADAGARQGGGASSSGGASGSGDGSGARGGARSGSGAGSGSGARGGSGGGELHGLQEELPAEATRIITNGVKDMPRMDKPHGNLALHYPCGGCKMLLQLGSKMGPKALKCSKCLSRWQGLTFVHISAQRRELVLRDTLGGFS